MTDRVVTSMDYVGGQGMETFEVGPEDLENFGGETWARLSALN
jgi:hypothetical protein